MLLSDPDENINNQSIEITKPMIDYFQVSIILCITECGISNPETRIVGGRPTGVNRYPWIARIVYDGHYHCGASLLTEDHVLTAAHCVRRFSVFSFCSG